MKAVRRVRLALVAGALSLSPAAALAQQQPAPQQQSPATPNSPTDAIGPGALQNFSLNGTVTRPAAAPPAPSSPVLRRQTRSQSQSSPPATDQRPAAAGRSSPTPGAQPQTHAASARAAPAQAGAVHSARQSPPPSTAAALQQADADPAAGSAAPIVGNPGFAPDPEPSAATLAPGHGFSLLPWLLAALALGAGGAFLFWRNRSRVSFAGVPEADAFLAPEPVPAPTPAPTPKARPAPPPSSPGIVSTRLRPWIEIGFHPQRCILDDEKVTLEFDIELFNSGSAPARAVLIEASLFNAGPAQEQDLGAFFANPVGQGDRVAVIPPLQRFAVKTQVSTPREQVLAYELAGRQVFVPVIAFNALYAWSGGEGQTSAAYLLGRDSTGDKMAPFRLDLGPRIFRGLAARVLPSGARD
jgi:hypothetical protein